MLNNTPSSVHQSSSIPMGSETTSKNNLSEEKPHGTKEELDTKVSNVSEPHIRESGRSQCIKKCKGVGVCILGALAEVAIFKISKISIFLLGHNVVIPSAVLAVLAALVVCAGIRLVWVGCKQKTTALSTINDSNKQDSNVYEHSILTSKNFIRGENNEMTLNKESNAKVFKELVKPLSLSIEQSINEEKESFERDLKKLYPDESLCNQFLTGLDSQTIYQKSENPEEEKLKKQYLKIVGMVVEKTIYDNYLENGDAVGLENGDAVGSIAAGYCITLNKDTEQFQQEFYQMGLNEKCLDEDGIPTFTTSKDTTSKFEKVPDWKEQEKEARYINWLIDKELLPEKVNKELDETLSKAYSATSKFQSAKKACDTILSELHKTDAEKICEIIGEKISEAGQELTREKEWATDGEWGTRSYLNRGSLIHNEVKFEKLDLWKKDDGQVLLKFFVTKKKVK